jgi:hypothetical protein
VASQPSAHGPGASGAEGCGSVGSAPLTDRQVELLRGLAGEPVLDRRGRPTPELDELVARGLAASTFVGHADIELAITDAGRRALAELDAPVPSSVYEVAEVREELAAFLATWRGALGEERLPRFKANLAFLIDLAVVRGLALDRGRLRRSIAALAPAGQGDAPTEALLAMVEQSPAGAVRGRSSRAHGDGGD